MTTDQEAPAEELDDAPEPDLSPLGADATAADIATSAEAHGQAAASARSQAGHGRAEAEEILGLYFPVLDHGFVSLVDYMGTDESVERAARVSYGYGTRQRSGPSLLFGLNIFGQCFPERNVMTAKGHDLIEVEVEGRRGAPNFSAIDRLPQPYAAGVGNELDAGGFERGLEVAEGLIVSPRTLPFDPMDGDQLDRRFQSEVANEIKQRFERNHERLFTFLQYDGVPWNNNNAEHAIKSFARLRDIIAGSSTKKGIEEYLTLLSVAESCKYRGVDFLDFLQALLDLHRLEAVDPALEAVELPLQSVDLAVYPVEFFFNPGNARLKDG